MSFATTSQLWNTVRFLCLGFFVPVEKFSLTIAAEGLQLHTLSFAQRSWPLSSEVSLACHTYTVTWGISEDPWHSYLLPSVWQWSRHYLFSRLRYVTARIRTPNLPLARRNLQPTAPPPRWNKVGISTLQQRLIINKFHRQRWNNIGHSTFKQREGFYFYSIPIKIQRRFKVEVRDCLTLVQRWIACWEKSMFESFTNILDNQDSSTLVANIHECLRRFVG